MLTRHVHGSAFEEERAEGMEVEVGPEPKPQEFRKSFQPPGLWCTGLDSGHLPGRCDRAQEGQGNTLT